MSKKVEDGTSRRDFLKLAATGAPAVAVVTVSTGGQADAAQPDLSSERMQDTAHTRAYFDSARF
ncbi:ubiquinol-cytochrome c reductase iron-sulfur subunit N-terminal domain-containing protein [Roseovarius pacificus]|uniref:ubiquinol-cytochrome c reductase iron-sulfur subunit N-terminal domain-containing protein n=1 Tax=Roseovarius pacificus TaxID=337701 RepID=UPI0025976D02|nr:ubiquinol-cytochrome c reductase iron-sulfur subunit N-terminal domain-containing protein [Roseovarius pacificus]MDW3118710.1 ubiquinol-cytochrome c reductase iron-sulfur subunit N-terminal domain-containing protein [Roseovarius pacificus]